MLSDLLQRKMTRLFHVYDQDRNGFLEQEDFERIAERLCQVHGWDSQTPQWAMLHENQLTQWHAIRQFADKNDDNKVSLDEYLSAYGSIPDLGSFHEQTVNQMVEMTFSFFDRDGDGRMNSDEFAEVYQVFDLNTDDAHRIFEEMDSDNDGLMNRDDALRLVREFYVSEDPTAAGNIFFGDY